MKNPKLELIVFVLVVIILASLKLPLESSDVFILPFLILILFRLWYLFKNGELTVAKDILSFYDNRRAVLYYGGFTVVSVLALWFLKQEIALPVWLKGHGNAWLWFMPVHILFQEIIFRTYLVNRIKLVFSNPWLIALISAIIFAGAHFILPNAQTVFVLTLISGFIWSYLYQKYPNLIYVWLSHLIIDFSINFIFPG